MLQEAGEFASSLVVMHSGRELLRLLRQHGFEVVSVEGSHYKLAHPDGRRVVLPFCNSQYPKKTYFEILKRAGLREDVGR